MATAGRFESRLLVIRLSERLGPSTALSKAVGGSRGFPDSGSAYDRRARRSYERAACSVFATEHAWNPPHTFSESHYNLPLTGSPLASTHLHHAMENHAALACPVVSVNDNIFDENAKPAKDAYSRRRVLKASSRMKSIMSLRGVPRRSNLHPVDRRLLRFARNDMEVALAAFSFLWRL
jgi:hypothetical protein